MTIQYTLTPTIFGSTFLAFSEEGLCRISFVNEELLPQELLRLSKAFKTADLQPIAKPYRQKDVQHYLDFQSASQAVHFQWARQGTEFQNKVWDCLRKIPAGHTTTYGEIARTIGHAKAVRAVGSAVGANPIAYWIPCHRVLPSSGDIGQFAWGSDLKRKFLAFDAIYGVKSPNSKTEERLMSF